MYPSGVQAMMVKLVIMTWTEYCFSINIMLCFGKTMILFDCVVMVSYDKIDAVSRPVRISQLRFVVEVRTVLHTA